MFSQRNVSLLKSMIQALIFLRPHCNRKVSSQPWQHVQHLRSTLLYHTSCLFCFSFKRWLEITQLVGRHQVGLGKAQSYGDVGVSY